nr:FYN-binding protein 1 isoform X2 [Ciona intestinalis]|eukprot:XP_018667699.1 FYN-binding protein 1 isoform X2 [Ciona intestinalis]
MFYRSGVILSCVAFCKCITMPGEEEKSKKSVSNLAQMFGQQGGGYRPTPGPKTGGVANRWKPPPPTTPAETNKPSVPQRHTNNENNSTNEPEWAKSRLKPTSSATNNNESNGGIAARINSFGNASSAINKPTLASKNTPPAWAPKAPSGHAPAWKTAGGPGRFGNNNSTADSEPKAPQNNSFLQEKRAQFSAPVARTGSQGKADQSWRNQQKPNEFPKPQHLNTPFNRKSDAPKLQKDLPNPPPDLPKPPGDMMKPQHNMAKPSTDFPKPPADKPKQFSSLFPKPATENKPKPPQNEKPERFRFPDSHANGERVPHPTPAPDVEQKIERKPSSFLHKVKRNGPPAMKQLPPHVYNKPPPLKPKKPPNVKLPGQVPRSLPDQPPAVPRDFPKPASMLGSKPPPPPGGPRSQPSLPPPPSAQDDVYDDTDVPPPLPPLMKHHQQQQQEPMEIPTWDDEDDEISDALYDETPDSNMKRPSIAVSTQSDQDDELYEDVETYQKLKAMKMKQEKPNKDEDKKKLDKKDKEMRKKFKLPKEGEITVESYGNIKEDARGGGKDLCVRAQEKIDIIRMMNNPRGKWLIRNMEGTYGFVDSDNVDVNMNVMKSTLHSFGNNRGSTVSHNPPQIPEEPEEAIYDETAPEDLYDEI